MNGSEFVDRVVEAVRDSAVRGTVSQLRRPSGREPRKDDVTLSQWFNSLSRKDRDAVEAAIRKGVDHAVFGFLCVLDGVRSISQPSDREELRLFAIGRAGEILLNDPSEELLHDLYQGAIGLVE